jgi:hypothetical protein
MSHKSAQENGRTLNVKNWMQLLASIRQEQQQADEEHFDHESQPIRRKIKIVIISDV